LRVGIDGGWISMVVFILLLVVFLHYQKKALRWNKKYLNIESLDRSVNLIQIQNLQFKIIEMMSDSNIKMVCAPDGVVGEGFCYQIE
jgi:uncharacterized membrane protein